MLAVLAGSALLAAAFVVVQAQQYGGLRTWWSIDQCVDQGGCWDYQHKRCEREDNAKCEHPAP